MYLVRQFTSIDASRAENCHRVINILSIAVLDVCTVQLYLGQVIEN